MPHFKEITPKQAYQLQQSSNALLLDMRDNNSFMTHRPKAAFHLTQESYSHFLQTFAKNLYIIVICYKGISSRNVAEILTKHGFEHCYTVSGGFEEWVKEQLPTEFGQI